MSSFDNSEFRGEDYQFIANGVFGEVFRVTKDGTAAGCTAVKRSKRINSSRFQRESIMREVRVMQTICGPAQCPYVVEYYSFWEHDDKIYIEMSFEEKGTLRNLAQSSFFPDESILRVLHDVSSALQYMHERHHLVHLDIKPANLLISKSGILKICDFGKTVPIGDPSDDDEGDTRYMAKELLDCAVYAPSADMFSLGLVAYELCYAHLPTNGPYAPAFGAQLPESGEVWHLLRGGFAPIPTFRKAPLVQLLQWLMLPDPAARPTAAQVRTADDVASIGRRVDPLLISSPSFVPVSFRDQRSDSFDPLVALDIDQN